MRAIAFAIFCWAMAADAYAQAPDNTWIVGVDKRGSEFISLFFVDADRIEVRGNVRRTWIRVMHSADNPTTALASMVTLTDYDCQGRTSLMIQSTAYERDGRARQMTVTGERRYVVPDSFDEGILDFVCASPAQRENNDQWIRLEGVTDIEMADAVFRRGQ